MSKRPELILGQNGPRKTIKI